MRNATSRDKHATAADWVAKKLENHAAQVSPHFWYYNCCREHATIKTTPAVAAGVARHPMDLVDLVRMLELDAAAPKYTRREDRPTRGPTTGCEAKDVGGELMNACAEPYGVSRSAGASRRCRPLVQRQRSE